MFDFFIQTLESFLLHYIFYMNKILVATLLGLLATAVYSCSDGELSINGQCTAVTYIAGCAQYIDSNSCGLCEYGYAIASGKCQYTEKPVTECCVLTDSNGVCVQCAPGLYLDGSSCSKIERPGCLEGKGLECINCAQGYQNVRGRCFKRLPNCKNYAENGICLECKLGFELIRGLCSELISLPSIPSCVSANEYGCVVCEAGTYLTKDRTCKNNQVGCLKYFRESCQLCSPEFKLVSGVCKMEGCTQQGSNGCSQCSSAYSLLNGRCTIENCLDSQDGRCLVCSSEYRIKNGKCVRPISTTCSTCANGFFVGQDGKCYRTVAGCASYNFDGKCSKCTEPFMLTNGVCVVPGCERTGVSGCDSCFRPFTLTAGRCIIQQCQEYNYQTKRCRSCNVGYHVEQGLCLKNHPLCGSYILRDSDEVCSSCISSDYILNDAGSCETKVPGCVYQNGKCITCASPFKRTQDNSCFIEGCATYSLNGCVKCSWPYSEVRGSCVIKSCEQVLSGKCERCSSGFHLSSTGICAEDDPKCQVYNGENCYKCINGYRLSSAGVCVRQVPYCRVQNSERCSECIPGYQLINGGCIVIDRNCEYYDAKLSGCTKCTAGYHTEAGVCKLNEPFCSAYESTGYSQKCVACASGYIFTVDRLRCIRQVPGCIYNDQGLCYNCRSPYVFNGKGCVIYGCSKYSESGCYECQSPAVRDNDRCVIQFCDTYADSVVSCSKCMAGYKVIEGKCFREDVKCVQYTRSGDCVKCIKDYVVFEGVCVKSDSYCLKYSRDGGCNKCKDKYYVSPDLICLPEEPGCVYQKGKCTYCNYPFRFHEPSQKCRIDGCLEAAAEGCVKCREPFRRSSAGICDIDNCVAIQDNHCVRCSPGYHLKQGMTCVKDDRSCLKYNDDGDCELCDKGYLLMSSGECEIAEDNCIERSAQGKQCTACKPEYFLNKFYQCQKKDKNCDEYNNGVCVNCVRRFFLYQQICFPYSPGCVSYRGKDCITCKTAYTLRNGECINLKKPSLKLEGEDEKYDFDITPIDITKSKYYIDNLSPASKLAKLYYSSIFSIEYSDPRLASEEDNLFPKGWKAQNARPGEYIGYTIEGSEPATFYAVQLEGIEGNYIKEFYVEYSVDSVNYIRIDKVFNSQASVNGIVTIYFTGVYASSIRLVVKSFVGWPASRLEFYYYDLLRFKKISNLKSLKYLKESIQSNFVDRMDNQMYINQRAFFNPAKACQDKSVCFSGLELCQQRTVNTVTIGCTEGLLKKVYITYSGDGVNFSCFEKCRHFILNDNLAENVLILNGLLAKNIRVYPVEWTGTPSVRISYDYS